MEKRYYRVWSDNSDGDLYTEAAYRELRLQLSTGDFGTHRAKPVILEDDPPYWDVDHSTGEFFLIETEREVE